MASLAIDPTLSSFAQDTADGLQKQQKAIPSKYLYDAVGSRLFDVITVLPEYGVTRAEARLLENHVDQIAARAPRDCIVAELGSGSGEKTRTILRELARREPITYFPIEISGDALRTCTRELGDLPSVEVQGIQREYLKGLEAAAAQRDGHNLFVLFLGSTLGNLSRSSAIEFLGQVRTHLLPGEMLLLGLDLIKPLPVLLAAYDDAAGVTAAFNRNLLARMNRELGADFQLSQFTHQAWFNAETCSVEMHLQSLSDQLVRIPQAGGLSVGFTEGETIWTESSHKYTLEEIRAMATESGFHYMDQWVDEEWGFAEVLLTPTEIGGPRMEKNFRTS